jgi:hypothetical protein
VADRCFSFPDDYFRETAGILPKSLPGLQFSVGEVVLRQSGSVDGIPPVFRRQSGQYGFGSGEFAILLEQDGQNDNCHQRSEVQKIRHDGYWNFSRPDAG